MLPGPGKGPWNLAHGFSRGKSDTKPKAPEGRRDEVVRQVIRYRFLDPDASADVIAQKLRQTGWEISARSVARVIAAFGLQKKLYAFRPSAEAIFVESQHTRRTQRREPSDAAGLERGVRQLPAQKISGTMVGVWLPAAEHLRLGTWDLLCGWTARPGSAVEPRLALQLVHEAALCVTGVRHNHCLSQKGFEVANGLPFVAGDQAIHHFLEAQTIERSQQLQMALGRLRRAGGHFRGQLPAIDPHHLRSYTQRQMRRHRHKPNQQAVKTLQTFFCLDTETHQPVAFTLGSAAKTVSQAAPELLRMVAQILQPHEGQALLHYPDRRHVEEFFNAYQAMGWNHAGTLNLHIRYAQLTLALVAQAGIHQLRQRLGEPYQHWEAGHLGKHLFQGLDGDVRVVDDTTVVTFYNAPNPQRLRQHYEHLPAQLQRQGVDPRVPWLYDFKLDFRFK